jgi:hypothetical protein
MLVEWELTSLSHKFFFYLDTGEFEEMIRLFTPDGIFDRAGLVHRGHDEIRQAMRDRPDMTTRHLLTNFYFWDVWADSAKAVVCVMAYHGPPQENGEAVVYATENGRVLDFHDEYTKTPDGWRLSSRIARPIFQPRVWP